MSGLSAQTRGLLDAARGADDPPSLRQHRVRQQLIAQLGMATMAGTAVVSAAAAASTPLAAATGGTTSLAGSSSMSVLASGIAKAVVGLTIVAGLGAGARTDGDAKVRSEGSIAVAASALDADLLGSPAVAPPEMAEDVAVVSTGIPTAKDDAESDVDESVDQDVGRHGILVSIARRPGHPVAIESELVLLQRAELAFAAKRPHRAARYLNAHALRFPKGALRENRESLRILIQCSLGASGSARAAAARFARDYPQSDQLQRLAESGCLPLEARPSPSPDEAP